MLRFLLWAALAFLFVRLISRLFSAGRQAPPPPPQEGGQPGVLVQDPVCGTFVDRDRAVTLRDRNGEIVYFCSRDCLKKYR